MDMIIVSRLLRSHCVKGGSLHTDIFSLWTLVWWLITTGYGWCFGQRLIAIKQNIQIIKVKVDIPNQLEQYSMQIKDGTKKYISTTNPEKSNWVRYIRPAPTRKQRNVSSVFKDDSVYFVACRNITKGDEILYWMDDPDLLWTKKKGEKKSKSFC